MEALLEFSYSAQTCTTPTVPQPEGGAARLCRKFHTITLLVLFFADAWRMSRSSGTSKLVANSDRRCLKLRDGRNWDFQFEREMQANSLRLCAELR
jgi:hypothetical protein